MELTFMRMSDLKEYENNPRDTSGAVDAVAESIRQCGYLSPIIIDEAGVILAGHTRYKALQKLGVEEIPVVMKTDLTEEQKKKYRILDNRVGELSYWDYEKLYEELEDLDFEGFAFGFEKLTQALDQDISSGFEFDMEDFDDEKFEHECPECGFRFN